MTSLRLENHIAVIPYVYGSMVAAGGSLVGTVVDLAPYEGNVLVNVGLAAGTGTLNLIVQHGSVNNVFATIGTDAVFTPDTGAVLSSGSIAMSNAAQGTYTFAINTDKAYQFLRILGNSVGAVPAVSIVALAPKKYANFS